MLPAPTLHPDDETGRTCGTCLVHKSFEHFYKDGKDSDGKDRYRRDCKECYRVTRLRADLAKKKEAAKQQARPTGRRKRK